MEEPTVSNELAEELKKLYSITFNLKSLSKESQNTATSICKSAPIRSRLIQDICESLLRLDEMKDELKNLSMPYKAIIISAYQALEKEGRKWEP